MRHAILILTLAGGILAAPLMCEAGVAVHDCVCDSTECCDEQATCELDPCDAVYEKQDRRKQDLIPAGVVVPLLIWIDVSPADEDSPATSSGRDTRRNRPFPDSDLPLLI